ncbi:MAG TPA: hypothetical protein VFQ39_10875 [Longimicrobium sp.]|nr:hypothetical protein [Longimicrobium sp.]
MGHSISGFIARAEVMRARTAFLREARVATLEQGLAFLPATSELYDALGGEAILEDTFFMLGTGLARLGAWLSRDGETAAYVETDYFGGTGTQAVIVWRDGVIARRAEKARLGVISSALTVYLGVEKGTEHDAFDAVGLDRHRSNDDWVERAEAESPPPVDPPPAPPAFAATIGYSEDKE